MAKIYTIPNIITFIRIILIPIILYLLFSENPNIVLLAGGLFIISSISDYFDGYLARVLNQSSKLGTLLDPIADKLLIASVIVVLVDTNVISNLHVIPAIIILLREIAISGLREFLAKMNTDMPVSRLAKYKTTFQMVSLSILIISLGFQLNDFLWNLGLVTLWIAAIITLLSGYNYMAKGLKHI
ncbi:CDP-diacylglycerol--glycerol-3-phosphate 3-phosphatidyltransferase [Alphaproteobacteria bacterium]|jgi:CDP-diacylglycerol--glycerol-3-phosphate 3-phosphatidyltransferase|nr:CDP-diacylglycerol--glycerol-3-phosphate 3-phosphatidyltransferase [Alphaproteobacteria bacterium]MDB3974290.1 CDP-diacylglycerol--glycerol-3-phosphate 3-phosphatidyltransferase [Alphaproteobacteria bacterium]|tara:strand:- start:89 stop:643 length:555 start_codon:yes stop_codon:yes gene_type:complete